MTLLSNFWLLLSIRGNNNLSSKGLNMSQLHRQKGSMMHLHHRKGSSSSMEFGIHPAKAAIEKVVSTDPVTLAKQRLAAVYNLRKLQSEV